MWTQPGHNIFSEFVPVNPDRSKIWFRHLNCIFLVSNSNQEAFKYSEIIILVSNQLCVCPEQGNHLFYTCAFSSVILYDQFGSICCIIVK